MTKLKSIVKSRANILWEDKSLKSAIKKYKNRFKL